jgi:DNA primase
MRYSDDFIEKVREANSIQDVIGSYVKLQRAGSSYKGLCPFHAEKTPSFFVHAGRQMYHCFGCGESGDVFTFLMKYENLDFNEALSRLAERAGIPMPEYNTSERKKKENRQRDRLLGIQKEAAKYFFCKLYSPSGKTALQYLKNRGLTEETIKSFGLGYAGKGANGLYEYLKKKDYSDAELKESGLFLWDEKHSQLSEKFWNRVMFPIMDMNRKVIGFGGRVMGDAKPKYLNSPETIIFDKSKNLYGLYAARSSRQKNIIICEGYMDVISLHQAGFTNAVASLGTALTDRQALLLRNCKKDICLLYDSDEAGVKAALRAVRLLKKAGISTTVADLKPYKDPDEIIKGAGSEELNARIEKAKDGFIFLTDRMYETCDKKNPREWSDFQHNAAREILTFFDDEIERDSYKKVICERYGLDEDAIDRYIKRLAKQGIRPEQDEFGTEEPPKKRSRQDEGNKAETSVLSWLCRSPGLFPKVKEKLSPDDFTEGTNRILAENIFKMYEEGNRNTASLLNLFKEGDEKAKAAAVLEGDELPGSEEDILKAVGEAIIKIKTDRIERMASDTTKSDMASFQSILDEKKKLQDMQKKLEKNK